MRLVLKNFIIYLNITLVLCFFPAGAENPHFDLVLKNGLVVDGTGKPPFKADVGISDGKISKIGDLGSYEAERSVNVEGLVVAPGFIDILCHNDLLWTLQEQENAIREGVTSGLAGNCGFSILDVQKNLKKLEKHRGLLNVGTLIGQGSVRDWFIRKKREKPAGAADMRRMKSFVEGALQAGAFGLSSGLGYEPGLWCQPSELEQLTSILSHYPHSVYYTHIRNYRSNVLEAIREAIHVAKTDQIPVVIQHLLFKLPSNWDQTESGLKLIEDARGEGYDVFATVYPYDFWGNEVQIPLYQFLYLPQEATRWDYYLYQAKTEDVLASIRRRLLEYGGGDKIEITRVYARDSQSALGLTLKELAKQRKLTEERAVLALLLENGPDVKICYHGLSEEGLIKKIQSPYILFGSDSSGSIPHPRDVGSFPRLLGTYVRAKRIIRLSEAINRLTQEPAKLLGLSDRGIIQEGYWGDIVVFNYNTIGDKATAVSPWEPPKGINMVLVNGQPVFEKGAFTGRFPGKVLRRRNE